MNPSDAAKLWADDTSEARSRVAAHVESLPTGEALAFLANMTCVLLDGWPDEYVHSAREGEALAIKLATYWVSC